MNGSSSTTEATAPGLPLNQAQQRLVNDHQRVVKLATNRYRRRCGGLLPQGDMEGYAQLGLIKAARCFDPNIGQSFPAFAWKWVTGEILRAVGRESQHRQHVRALVHASLTDIGNDMDKLMASDEERREHALKLMRGAIAAVVVGLVRAPKSPEQEVVQSHLAGRVRALLADLDPALRKVIELRYHEQRTLTAIATELGVSYPTVRRYHDQALSQLAVGLKTTRRTPVRPNNAQSGAR